jgi:hypothetical protein
MTGKRSCERCAPHEGRFKTRPYMPRYSCPDRSIPLSADCRGRCLEVGHKSRSGKGGFQTALAQQAQTNIGGDIANNRAKYLASSFRCTRASLKLAPTCCDIGAQTSRSFRAEEFSLRIRAQFQYGPAAGRLDIAGTSPRRRLPSAWYKEPCQIAVSSAYFQQAYS